MSTTSPGRPNPSKRPGSADNRGAPDPEHLSDAEYKALGEFRHALRVFLRFSENAARDEGITPNQHQLLLAVRAESTDPGISELAQRLQLKANSTLELVRRAEAAGLVTLSPAPEDQRRQLVSLSQEGSACLARLSEMHREELRRFRTEAADLLAELR